MTVERTSKWGQTVIVDDIDVDLLPEICRVRNPNVYVKATNGLTMGRAVLERKLGRELLRQERADHINLNKLDNRRENIRLATQQQNCVNVDIRRRSKNQYKGAYVDYKGRFYSFAKVENKTVQLGRFETALDAHRAWCIQSLTQWGQYANFGSNSPFMGWSLDDLKTKRLPELIIELVPEPPRRPQGIAATSQFKTLQCLARHIATTAEKLTHYLDLSINTIFIHLRLLKLDGYVEVSTDSTEVRYTLTEKGRQAVHGSTEQQERAA